MAQAFKSGLNLVVKATTGAPTTGTWVVGDLAQDSDGVLYRCTVAGTPGTWALVGASSDTGAAILSFAWMVS